MSNFYTPPLLTELHPPPKVRITSVRNRIAGFSLIELMITLAIIWTISAIAVPSFLAAIDAAKIARAVGDIRTIGDAAVEYDAVNNQYPDDLTEIGYGSTLDPWGHPYQYLDFADVKGKGKMRKDRFLVPINTAFDLYSMGKDGQSVAPLTAQASQDDIIWANDGAFIGPASEF